MTAVTAGCVGRFDDRTRRLVVVEGLESGVCKRADRLHVLEHVVELPPRRAANG